MRQLSGPVVVPTFSQEVAQFLSDVLVAAYSDTSEFIQAQDISDVGKKPGFGSNAR